MRMPAQDRPASLPSVDSVAASLRTGHLVCDEAFDQVYSPHHRAISPCHWTPIDVATRAARLLATGGRRLFLDVGSGVGKFCIAGALTTEAIFVGVEQRPHLVAAAQAAAGRFGAERARFFEGDFSGIDFACFDGFYLFNPFEEQLRARILPIDRTIGLSPRRFRFHLLRLLRKLRGARSGSRVLTYCGHGGPMPPGFRVIRSERARWDVLMLWEKE